MRSVITETGKNFVNIRGESPNQWGARTFMDAVRDIIGIPHSAMEAVETIAVVFADHGLNPPSTINTRLAASCGGSLPVSLIAGLAAFSGPFHGGAVVGAASMLADMANGKPPPSGRTPGLGHPIHDEDPRVSFLIERFPGAHVSSLITLAEERSLKPNIAGVSAAILLDASLPIELIQFPMVIGRLIGLTAHWAEQSRDPHKNIVYIGHEFSS